MTPDQINIAILLLEYAGWVSLFSLLYAGACRVCRVCRMWEKRRR